MPLLPAAIGIILNTDRSDVLLIRRHDVSVWVLPGGGIEPGERPEEALLREIHEETGFNVKIVRQCAEYFPINRLASHTSVFICKIQSGQICPSVESSSIEFFPLNQLPSMLFPPHAIWIHEAVNASVLIKRTLNETSYLALCKYFIFHPWEVLRFAWTRFIKN